MATSKTLVVLEAFNSILEARSDKFVLAVRRSDTKLSGLLKRFQLHVRFIVDNPCVPVWLWMDVIEALRTNLDIIIVRKRARFLFKCSQFV